MVMEVKFPFIEIVILGLYNIEQFQTVKFSEYY